MNGVRYVETADILAGELAKLPPGAKLASEHKIAGRFGVSRAAARAAVQELERRLLVRRVRGSGTFVSRRIDYRLSPDQTPSWHHTARDAGAVPRSVVRDIQCLPLPAEIAELLRRGPGEPAHLLVRQYYLDDLVASWTNEWIPLDVLTELDIAVRTVESVDEILRQLGRVRPARAWCRVSMAVPDATLAAALDIEGTRPVWLVESMSRDVDSKRPVMCSKTWTRTDAVRIVVEMDDGTPSRNGA